MYEKVEIALQKIARTFTVAKEKNAWYEKVGQGVSAVRSARRLRVADPFAARTAGVIAIFVDSRSGLAKRAVTILLSLTTDTVRVSFLCFSVIEKRGKLYKNVCFNDF